MTQIVGQGFEPVVPDTKWVWGAATHPTES